MTARFPERYRQHPAEVIDELGAGQKLRDRHHRSLRDRFAASAYKRARSSTIAISDQIKHSMTARWPRR